MIISPIGIIRVSEINSLIIILLVLDFTIFPAYTVMASYVTKAESVR